jgi:hypothetical protein
MPLAPSEIASNFDEACKMVGLWMRDPGVVGPLHGVRVFVTLEALWALDPLSVRDVPAALEICEEQRGKIHLAASRKFDYSGPEQGEKHEGRPAKEIATRVIPDMDTDTANATSGSASLELVSAPACRSRPMASWTSANSDRWTT